MRGDRVNCEPPYWLSSQLGVVNFSFNQHSVNNNNGNTKMQHLLFIIVLLCLDYQFDPVLVPGGNYSALIFF